MHLSHYEGNDCINYAFRRVQEVAFARDIVKLALECKSYLTEIVNHALDHHDKDLSFVSESLQRALKVIVLTVVCLCMFYCFPICGDDFLFSSF